MSVNGSGTIHGETVYYIDCPGQSSHTTNNSSKDCYVGLGSELDGIRWLYCKCFHNSCLSSRQSFIKEMNKKWAKGLPLSNDVKPRIKFTSFGSKLKGVVEANDLKKKATNYVPPSPYTGTPINENHIDDFKLFVSMWNEKDIIFIGERGQSWHNGAYFYEMNWEDIMNRFVPKFKDGKFPYYTIQTTLISKAGGRKEEHCGTRKFIVFEMDNETKENQWKYLFFIRDYFKINLRLIIDSGGKSLHGWFDYDENILTMKSIFKHFGYDTKLFEIQQPVRLPGGYRQEKQQYQRVLYNKINQT